VCDSYLVLRLDGIRFPIPLTPDAHDKQKAFFKNISNKICRLKNCIKQLEHSIKSKELQKPSCSVDSNVIPSIAIGVIPLGRGGIRRGNPGNVVHIASDEFRIDQCLCLINRLLADRRTVHVLEEFVDGQL
jgi:hypothetical protein